MTYCLAILMQIRTKITSLIIKEAHYTPNSLITDASYNGQDYTIEIKPKPKCRHTNYVIFADSDNKHCLSCGVIF